MNHQRPIQSPYPALQALLPRLNARGRMEDFQPLFYDEEEAELFLDDADEDDPIPFIVPVWAIDHLDLSRSEIVRWTLAPWVH